MKVPKALLLQQQYLDTWNDYKLSKDSKMYPVWDYIIITASNDFQAKGYDQQIQQRIDFLPKRTKFITISDEKSERIGSGGATLKALKKIMELEKKFDDLRILLIHSGGDSSRIPQYSALGKLFSPIPRVLPDGRSSSLFDEIIISMSSVASRIKEGMVILSGNVLLLFNPLKIDFSSNDIACITFKEKPENAHSHGIILSGKNYYVKKCLQKKSVETLNEIGALDKDGFVDINTGIILMSCNFMKSLYNMVDNNEKYFKMVNSKTRLNLYVDFLYPLAEESTLESFCEEKPEGELCNELIEARKTIWEELKKNKYKLKQIKLSPSAMIHFCSIPEVMSLMNKGINDYRDLGWNNIINSSSDDVSSYNSIITPECSIGLNSYIEISYIHEKAKIGKNVYLSFVEINDEIIPDNVTLHSLKLNNNKIVCRIFGINDDLKENKIFGKELTSLPFDIKKGENLWNAKIFPECNTMSEAVSNALNIYKIVNNDGGDLEQWKKYNKKSISDFKEVNTYCLIEWNKKMENLIKCGKIERLIYNKKNVENVNGLFTENKLNDIQQKWFEEKIKNSSFEKKIRMLYFFGVAIDSEELINRCFKEIKDAIVNDVLKGIKFNEECKIVKEKHKVTQPLRVNFAGGWTDTPPYCLENGGIVLNAPILLNNNKPVEVIIEKIKEKKIILESKDIDEKIEYSSISDLQDINDPFEPFSLQKSCLIVCGIIPKEGGNLEEILERIGSGFIIRSEVIDTPKGSGLGTTSILAYTVAKAIYEFFGIEYENNDLYIKVLAIEQIMTTGGGWQDQVGGGSRGINIISSEPGIHQKINKKKLKISEKTIEELEKRFFLIYTGERRLSRNLLREIESKYLGNVEESIRALKKIKELPEEMAYALESGNIDLFGILLNVHLEYSKILDRGTTNSLIQKIFAVIDDLIVGKMVCGAGGGGFLQVILKENVTKEMVHNRLRGVFPDSEIDIWECSIHF